MGNGKQWFQTFFFVCFYVWEIVGFGSPVLNSHARFHMDTHR